MYKKMLSINFIMHSENVRYQFKNKSRLYSQLIFNLNEAIDCTTIAVHLGLK